MARKELNNKVEFMAGGESLIMKLSDEELRSLRHSSQWCKGDDWEHMLHGRIHNFAIYALLDYDWKSPYKRGKFEAKFPYRKYDNIDWFLVKEYKAENMTKEEIKSIKEKSEEYAKTAYTDENLIENASWDFEAGANYVLDEIESLMKDVSDEYPRFQQGTIIHGRLIKLLEQLKK